MSQYYESNRRTFTSGSALNRYLRVKTPAAVVVAASTDVSLGVVDAKVLVSGDPCTVLLRNAQGTRPMVASGAIAVGAIVYGDAGGKVTATSGGETCGTALTAATADNDIIEVLPN